MTVNVGSLVSCEVAWDPVEVDHIVSFQNTIVMEVLKAKPYSKHMSLPVKMPFLG